ncbi:hypothetical protein QAD02_003867 [Eretmocerus hayati]|uniref:Uncharacterized protein n=1 Tax=Eretmocerus hayati TaxID=131215 RepID=A0ACC2NN32_9HYME|nr:hypothetical protein QAD02_003867 [Eretmocerus hayati]
MSSTKRVRKHRLKSKILKAARVKVSEYSSEESNKESDYSSDVSRPSDSQSSDDECPDPFAQSSEDPNLEESGTSDDSESNENQFEFGQSDSNSSDIEGPPHFDLDAQDVERIEQHPNNTQDEVQELRLWAVKNRIAMCHTDELLHILRRRVLPELPACSKTFLDTSSACYVIEEMIDTDHLPGESVYSGIEQGLQACGNPELHDNMVIDYADINIDGVKIKKSSLKQLWPCLCRVYYKKIPEIYKPSPVFAFYGNKKPKDLKMYFHRFIEEMDRLSRTGVMIKGKLFRIRIRRFINGKPARDLFKCTSGHSSLNGCSRCVTVAVKIDNNVVYIDVGNPRTNDDSRNFTDTNHHLLEVSPLIALDPPIDMILAFILDIMYLFYLGSSLRLFQYWESGNTTVKLSVAQREELDRRTKILKGDIPYGFKRKMCSTNHFLDLKATDRKFSVLYCGPIVLKKILSDQCYDHSLLLYVASRMISSKEALEYSRLTSLFVEKSKILYGLKFVSVNDHSLHHVGDDIVHSGSNANYLSAFPFESDLCKAKYMLKSPNYTQSLV